MAIAVSVLLLGGVTAGILLATGDRPAAPQGHGAPAAGGGTGTHAGPTHSRTRTSSSTTSGTKLPPSGSDAHVNVPHVMVIVLENHGYGAIIGNPTAPYLNGLADRYGLATASFATTHPSLPNYLMLASGSTQGVTTDCTACTAGAPQLADQLQSAGISWHAYMESAPTACYTGGAYPYDRHHDPFVYAPHLVDDRNECANVVPFNQLGPALLAGTAPCFIWITPNVEHDMHTGSVAEGDAWLSQQLPGVLRSSWYEDQGVVVITWDEGTTDAGCCGNAAAGGHVATIVVSARTPHGGRSGTSVDGAGILRTVEALYGLPFLGAAADPVNGTLLPLLGMRRAAG